MSSLYVSQHERSALRSIDTDSLKELIDGAVWSARSTGLQGLRLASCGAYVAERLRRFERDLGEYARAKSAQKRSDTRSRAISAGSDLVWAVRDMQHRVEEEDKELERFRIDDLISPPHRLRERLEIRVSFEWRRAPEDSWNFGTITFGHDVDMRPDYTKPAPKRKPSAARQEEERQEELYRHWEHFRLLALHSVREYLKEGGDGAAIPSTFEARAGTHSRFLDNFSCKFWKTLPTEADGAARSDVPE